MDKSTTLMVGTAWKRIFWGMRFGVDTCWYNPHGKAPLGDIQPTYTIRTLEELSQIVLA